MNRPYAIAVKSAPATPLLVLGTGLPQKVRDKTCHYIQREMAYAKRFHHRGSGEEIDLTPERLAKLSASIQRRAAKGIFPPLTPYHVEPAHEFKANDTLGYVIGSEFKDGKLYANLQVIGDDSLDTVDKNGLSIATFIQDVIDADGEPDEETLHHLAATPDGALPGLCPTLKIAASAGGGPAREVRIFTLSAADRSNPMFKPETLKQLRAKFKLTDDASEADVAEKAAALALAEPPPDKGPEVTALSAKVKTLETERDTAKAEAETLRLSAAPLKEPDALSLSLIGRAFKTDAERVIESGVLSSAGMDELKELCIPNGKPAPFAMALSAGSPDPFWSRLCEILRRHPGVKTDAKVKRDGLTLAAGPNHQSYDPDAKEPEKPITPERRNALLAYVGAAPVAAK